MTDKAAFEALLDEYERALTAEDADDKIGAVRCVRARAAVLAAYEAKQSAPFKPTGNPELDAVLLKPDPAFDAFVASLPDNYWARYDLSAVRLGWHFGRTAAGREEQPVAKVVCATCHGRGAICKSEMWPDRGDGIPRGSFSISQCPDCPKPTLMNAASNNSMGGPSGLSEGASAHSPDADNTPVAGVASVPPAHLAPKADAAADCSAKLRSLRERLRPSIECAPWVIDEIDAMLAASPARGGEGEAIELLKELRQARPLLLYGEAWIERINQVLETK